MKNRLWNFIRVTFLFYLAVRNLTDLFSIIIYHLFIYVFHCFLSSLYCSSLFHVCNFFTRSMLGRMNVYSFLFCIVLSLLLVPGDTSDYAFTGAIGIPSFLSFSFLLCLFLPRLFLFLVFSFNAYFDFYSFTELPNGSYNTPQLTANNVYLYKINFSMHITLEIINITCNNH